MDNRYKIIGICQVYNELERENLDRFFKYNKRHVDEFIIYDDCSTDGTYEYCLTQTPYVLRGTKNCFSEEMSHKQKLLSKALEIGADFILWLDADEVLTESSDNLLQEICAYCEENEIDGLNLKKINLWRSNTWKRVDSLYDDGWFTQFWRITPGIGYTQVRDGLHQAPYPDTMKKIENTNLLAVLHYGFANELNLSFKYLTYKSHGQDGYMMLDRIINEDLRKLAKVDKNIFPEGLWVPNESEPQKLSMSEAMNYVHSFRNKVIRPKYSVVCLIYKSIDWLQFVYSQVLKHTDLSETEFFFVANDPTDEVRDYLKYNYIPHHTWENTEEQKKDWHINNVYRAYNYGVNVAQGDFVILINSDMAFSPGWVDKLIEAYDGKSCIAARLVESGKLRSGTYGIEKDFGRSYSEYKESSFLEYADTIRENIVKDSGLFMPLFIRKVDFEKVGGYPEGNILANSDLFNPTIAKRGDELISGDNVLMRKLATKGIGHKTAFGSIIYHFQSGELDETIPLYSPMKSESIAICNDITTGTMGEKVLWDFLLEGLPGTYSIDKRVIGKGGDFEYKAREYIKENKPETSVIIQNATFISTISDDIYTIAFLQDDLRSMGRTSTQQEMNLKLADRIVTNSIQTSLSYKEYPCDIISVGIDTDLFRPLNRAELRKKYGFPQDKTIGIFVGSFSEVKGWSKVTRCFEENQNIHWIAISKYEESFEAANVTVFNRVDQNTLAELLNCANFFIIGSPVETQCLAALEALLCDIPVLMPLVGLFRDFTEEECSRIGIFTDNLSVRVSDISTKKFTGMRSLILEKHLGVEESIIRWRKLLEEIFLEKRLGKVIKSEFKQKRKFSIFKIEFLIRKYFLKYIGLEYFNFKKITTISGFRMMVYEFLATHNLLPFVKKILGKRLRTALGFKS